jgi:hypothetical protein
MSSAGSATARAGNGAGASLQPGSTSFAPATAAPATSVARPSGEQRRAPAQPVARPAPRPANTNAAHSGGFSSSDVERVYGQYLAAREKNAERIDNVKRETIEKSIRGMLPQLEKKHAGKKIDFEVVVKDGKVALKPVAK